MSANVCRELITFVLGDVHGGYPNVLCIIYDICKYLPLNVQVCLFTPTMAPEILDLTAYDYIFFVECFAMDLLIMTTANASVLQPCAWKTDRYTDLQSTLL